MKNLIRLNAGKKIRELRRKCGYAQEKFSEVASIDYKYLQRIKGKNPPNLKLETLAKFAKAFKIPLSELLNFK